MSEKGDQGWEQGQKLPGVKGGSICNYCGHIMRSGGVTRLKYHFSGTEIGKNVKVYSSVPPEVKEVMKALIKKTKPHERASYKEAYRQSRASEWDRDQRANLFRPGSSSGQADFLNPKYQHKDGVGEDPYFRNAIHKVFKVLDPNSKGLSQFGNEIMTFKEAKKLFGDSIAKASRENMRPGNPDPRILRHAQEHDINVEQVLSSEVGLSSDNDSFENAMRGPSFVGSTRDDDDDGSGGGGGDGYNDDRGNNTTPQNDDGGTSEQQDYMQKRLSPFTCEEYFTHATQDEDHGSRRGGPGIDAIGKQHRRSAGWNPLDENDISNSFESMSISTEQSSQRLQPNPIVEYDDDSEDLLLREETEADGGLLLREEKERELSFAAFEASGYVDFCFQLQQKTCNVAGYIIRNHHLPWKMIRVSFIYRVCEKIFSNGDAYVGDFKVMIPHGKGKYMWSDGTFYEGEWEEGKMTGNGKISWPSQATYEGDFSGGYLHGFGTSVSSDGSIYRGSWKMNSQHGIGRKQYPNSDIYDGCWREGVREGSGRYAWSNGNIYIGNWKNGRMSGRGVMKWFNGDLFDGFWSNGLRHGSGFYRFNDGSYYFGTWSKGLKDGPGIYYPAGNKHLRKLNLEGQKEKKKKQPSHISSKDSEESVKPSVKRSLSDKLSSSFRRGSGRLSHKTTSLDDEWGRSDSVREVMSREPSCIISHSSCDGQAEFLDNRNVAYEREYMQGVLIKERARNMSKLSHKSKQRLKFAKEVKKGSCVDIFEGHRSYYLMLNLQLGIRYTVGKITPVPKREVRSTDFGEKARIRMYFPRKGSRLTPSHNSMDFYWKDYCPMVFRNLRELFKLNAADYMMSICGDDGLKELSSPGKSGSLFYLSLDDRFVIKTLKKSELKVLLKMLPHYYGHVQVHENTLITKFFGAHRIALRHGKKVRFVVMGNMFCTELRIHRRYDLKGSSHGRFTNKDKIDESTTLKDLDLTYEFHMDRSLHESLFRQLSVDSAFLESQQIIDYSLLLGLHFRAPEHLRSLLDSESLHNTENTSAAVDGVISQGELLIPPRGLLLVTHEPGSVSTDPGPHVRGNALKAYSIGDKEADLLLPGTGRLRVQLGVNMPAQANHKLVQAETVSTEVELFEVYDVILYLGIIDILQEYNTRKKLEHACKSLKFDPMSISVVEPKLYSKRFITFLERIFPLQPSDC
ncbi:hypothetical protein BUALT_Bualt15G0081300 [Buddleja alternifolia]|uniref:1-phosphatidylinositol-4-phosphate 5-kinase n=1 Tax=Buddleja alternifolia TaxID=168488 RepID=A0AAV6WP52_9LAMI|nr:hypothetical protein BUALT_Bualt15G0081300 [Buddleja alternifolia]